MRLWSIHPKYLDQKGLLACWREALLAKKVLRGETIGYKNHSQIIRFKKAIRPLDAINYFLSEVYKESISRNYHFDSTKIDKFKAHKISVTRGQVAYEFAHLLSKLKTRDHERYLELRKISEVEVNGLFKVVDGEVEEWERVN